MAKPKITTKRFKAFAIDHNDKITLLCLYQSLHMAERHKTYLAHPYTIRQSATHWLGKVGVTVSKTARWSTLLNVFCDYYRAVLPIDAENNPLPIDKA